MYCLYRSMRPLQLGQSHSLVSKSPALTRYSFGSCLLKVNESGGVSVVTLGSMDLGPNYCYKCRGATGSVLATHTRVALHANLWYYL